MSAAAPRYRDVALGGSLSAHFTQRDDGSTLVRSTEALGPYPERITDRLLHWAAVAPDRTLVAKRHQGGDWRR
jgi:feruloyl-CoA synthase